MNLQLETLRILNTLRSNKLATLPISRLLDEYGGQIPNHTGGGIFGHCFSQLADKSFIKVLDAFDNDITQKITSIVDPEGWGGLSRGYAVARFLMMQEDKIFVTITAKLGETQELLGFSLTNLIKEYENKNSILLYPVFGKPVGFPVADIFVLMPFDKQFTPVYDDHIKNVCKKIKRDSLRADNLFSSTKIMSDIWELINNSKLIIADCTGKNPNVFYELGIAHTVGKNVIIITQNTEDIPFDIRHLRYIKYDYTPRGMILFEQTLEKFILDISSEY